LYVNGTHASSKYGRLRNLLEDGDDGISARDEDKVAPKEMEELEEQPSMVGTSKEGMRLLNEEEGETKSVISIEKSVFSGNKVFSTIMVSSHSIYSENSDQLSHSIHLNVDQTEFISEEVETSVIVNSGGKLSTSRSLFIDNKAESIISSESGTTNVIRTEFARNEVSNDEGIIVLDAWSQMEESELNCANDESVYNRRKLVVCNGVIRNEECQEFGIECADREQEVPITSPTPRPAPGNENDFPTYIPTFFLMGDDLPPCPDGRLVGNRWEGSRRNCKTVPFDDTPTNSINVRPNKKPNRLPAQKPSRWSKNDN